VVQNGLVAFSDIVLCGAKWTLGLYLWSAKGTCGSEDVVSICMYDIVRW
jgi:hypothetical protein